MLNNVKLYRLKANLTQNDLAKLAGLTRQTIYLIRVVLVKSF
ncbi:helix-turn-helix domain-containing protein [Lactobacillus helveticus]|nr:helix-turn-helix domain-containing protein [Lactobacillus helveticus]